MSGADRGKASAGRTVGNTGSYALLPERVRRWLPVITLATAVWVAGLGALVANKFGPVGPDGLVDRTLSPLYSSLRRPAQDVAAMGEASHFAFVVVVVLVICAAGRSVRTAVVLLVSVAVNLVAVEGIKEIVRRRMIVPGYQIILGYTFPSGHAATAAVVATVAVLVCRRGGPLGRYLSARQRTTVAVVAALIVTVVSASMILVRDHFFLDTVPAVPLAVTITLLVAAGVDAMTRRPAGPPAVPSG